MAPETEGSLTRGQFFEFPRGFLWGAATAAHQVEGHNDASDWWLHELDGQLPYRSGDACDHYQRYADDFDLARSWGHNAHRLSIEWARIEPNEGELSREALQHYRDVIDALREREIEPVVTLNHFTLPAWFARTGGWLRRDSVELFERYAGLVAEQLSGVRYWLTINEPTVYVKNGFLVGQWPPFRVRAWSNATRVLSRLARVHRVAYDRLHASADDVLVGFAHSAPFIVACGLGGWRDRFAAWLRDLALNDLFFALVGLGRFPGTRRGRFDFIGLNYYTRTIVRAGPGPFGGLFGAECREDHHSDLGPENELGWPSYPPGILEVARKFSRFGVPLLITENGLATADDEQRGRFIEKHVAELAKGISSGIDIRGYLHWTLMDNFEWAHGREAHFGLAAVEPLTGRRLPRASSRVFADICSANGLDLP